MTRSVETHVRNLGALIANLQTLEFYIRAVLSELPDSASCGLIPGENIYDLKVGDELLDCPMTNFDSLGDLIRKFNEVASQRGWEKIDSSLVAVRDALAHGRIAYPSDDHQHPHLMKFAKPNAGSVRITFNEEMSPAWFAKQIERAATAHKLVASAGQRLRTG